ncbi:TRAP transporter small permease subunit [Halalkalibacter oceani]|uniref:TRAP transporter small permease subunit n=1 Tax=Halalkalibacter oceani TaxID=1653776 RepID=UPI0033948141
MKKITEALDKTTEWVGKISSWSVVVLMLLVVFEVISRRVFNQPTIWTFEITTMIFAFHFLMVSAYGLLHKSLVSVEIIYERFSLKTKAVLDLITYSIFFLPFVIGLLYGGYHFAALSWAQQEVSWSAFAPPVYPIKTVLPVAMFFLLLQGISEIMKKVIILVERKSSYD